MKKIKYTFFFFLSFFFAGQLLSQSSTVKMFRDNPAHLVKVTANDNSVFDTRQWKFEAGAPVRSTPLVVGNWVYFGTTGGDFFSIDKRSGAVKWKRKIGSPVNSSAAFANGRIFFSDNQQKLYAVKESSGDVIWSVQLGTKLDYPWRFDYYYSSPVIYNGKVIIGSDDGNMYVFDAANGKLIWKFNAGAVIRATPAIYENHVLFGDVSGKFHSLDFENGKEEWIFKGVGDTLKNEDWGFDRKAILSSAVVYQNKAFFGCRAGFLYCINAKNGNLIWKMDHKVSWVISTPAIKDSIVVTGTSDGRFIQAINIETGKEIWKFRTPSVVWSSPLIVGDVVYGGDFDGQFYCIDLKTGKRISELWTAEKIMSSPVYDDQLLYFGSDDGNLYALKARPVNRDAVLSLKKFVFYDPSAKGYFNNGTDARIRAYLGANGYKTIRPDTLLDVMSRNGSNTTIVFASNYFPASVIRPTNNSALRTFLESGGRVVVLGPNPLVYKLEEETKQPMGFNVPFADSVLGLKYGPNDTRAFGGQFACFATEEGKAYGLQDFWTSLLFISPEKVDLVLGKNENGLASSFVKKYARGGAFVQLIMNANAPQNLDCIIKVAEGSF